jgi:hypothetical protein
LAAAASLDAAALMPLPLLLAKNQSHPVPQQPPQLLPQLQPAGV